MVVNELYYGTATVPTASPAGSRTTAPVAVASGFAVDSSVIARALRNIYSSDFADDEIEPALFGAVADILNTATDTGTAQATFDPDEAFKEALRHSNEVFAAFKVHRAQNDMAARLLDSNGNLKPFEQWRDEVLPIASHQCGAWMRTEYDTAVIRAHQAADWQQFQAEKDVLPNLKWMPSTSANPGADHMPFWGTVLPVDHPFWDLHRPGDRWNCKCSLTNTDEKTTPVPGSPANGNDPQQGLDENPGKTGATFSQKHPYFPNSCSQCSFYKPTVRARLRHSFQARVKDCYNCPYINGCITKTNQSSREKKAMRQKEIISRVDAWAARNLAEHNTPTGMAKRLYVSNNELGSQVIVNRQYFAETFAKNKRNRELARVMRLATMVREWLPTAKVVRTEAGRHHRCLFKVFETEFRGVTIEAKAKDNGTELILYTMRIKE